MAVFAAKYSWTVSLLWVALFRLGCAQDIVFPEEGYFNALTKVVDTSGSPGVKPPASATIPGLRQVVQFYCSAPPQPVNGEWRIRQDFCNGTDADCKVPEGTKLQQSYELVYTCATGYRSSGDNMAYCRSNGHWSSIPSCVEIKCGALNTATRIAYCFRYRKTVSCDIPVLPWTQADLSCRPGYRGETTSSKPHRNVTTCNEDGEWGPRPLKCIPVVLHQLGWSQNISNILPVKDVNISPIQSPHVSLSTSIERPELDSVLEQSGQPPQASKELTKFSCPAPPQPINGEWRIRKDICKEINATDCKVPEGTKLGLSYELVYGCAPGYKTNGDNIIYCRRNGYWSSIPSCVMIQCGPLNTASRTAQCTHSRKPVSCDFSVPPWTKAELSCRPGYREDLSVIGRRKNLLTCNENGEWEPNPLRCIPVCGQAAVHQTPLVIEGSIASVGDFPWHVSLHKQKSASRTKKSFLCGATLIETNMLLTAAHCVYDETSRRTEAPEQLFVITGNFFRDYDDSRHNSNIVRKSTVKSVHMYHTYHGLPGNFASDIALLELDQPFVYSEILLPACLDTSGNSAPFLESGVPGRLAGFGRTATGESSSILQTLTVPYIPHGQCKSSKNAARNEVFITKDKFCAGYTNGSAVCEGDSGGGLMFQKNNLWYVLGIVSVGLGVNLDNGEKSCERYAYTLYTRVSEYMEWILEVIADANEPESSHRPWKPFLQPVTVSTMITHQPTPPSVDRSTPAPNLGPAFFPIPTASNAPALSSCLVPPQPANGQWKLHASLCDSNEDCNIIQGTELEPGSQLIFKCDPGYKVKGHIDVYCGSRGSWTSRPTCIEIRCPSLNSPSRTAYCLSQSGNRVECNSSSLPQTMANVSCRRGYVKNEVSVANRTTMVECNSKGKWAPEPIECTPVCGRKMTQQPSFVLGGSVANLGEFPWQASVYLEEKTRKGFKNFICGATLIQENLLLTAAHCVYDETTRSTIDPTTLFVILGNIFRDYDSPRHDERIIQRGMVKNVISNCQYYGIKGNYGSDIALLQMQESFQLSEIFLPACLDISGDSARILEAGTFGRIPGFTRNPRDESSSVLETSRVPYLSYNECLTSKGGAANAAIINADKFCAGYINGTAMCRNTEGGGLVFDQGSTWYVLGIASVSLKQNINGDRGTCGGDSLSLYTRVSYHMSWIQKVMWELERFDSYPSCF